MTFKLTKAQKDEVRQLAQRANDRIRRAQKAYAKEGQHVIPREIAGDLQIKEQWHTDKSPISRSVKFESEQAYKDHIKYLRGFEAKQQTLTDFVKSERVKTVEAVENVTGDVSDELAKRINKMSGAELRNFWNRFSEKATRMGVHYSSEQALADTALEFFGEDITAVQGV